jgi:tRNA modification GTPase
MLVSGIAGATRDAVQERIFIDGFAIDLIDTAGLRETEDALEIESQEITIQNIEKADAVLFLSALGEETKQAALFEKLLKDKPLLSVLNKIDLAKKKALPLLDGILKQKIKISLIEKQA